MGWWTCEAHGLLDDLDLRPEQYPHNEGRQYMTTDDNVPALISVPDAAKMLGISVKTVRRMIESGRLETVVPNRRAFIRTADVLDYLRRNRTS